MVLNFHRLLLISFVFVLTAAPQFARAQDAPPIVEGDEGDSETPAPEGEDEALGPWWLSMPGVEWVNGPGAAALGSRASVQLVEGLDFTGNAGTRVVMQAMQNSAGPADLGTVFHRAEGWFAVFTFDDSGYVSDEEKDDLDADAMLETMTENNRRQNEARAAKGWDSLVLDGWHTEPHYDSATNNLEWGLLLSSVNGQTVNYEVRLLGRRGVMNVNLVCDPSQIATALPEFRKLISTHEFAAGETYGEFRDGDKVAAYGLGALVTGGAIAAAVKTGFLQKFWKLIVAGVVAAIAAVKKLFGGGKSSDGRPERRRIASE